MLFQCGSCPLGWVNQAFSGSPACHASWHPVTACINTRPLVIIIAAMNSLKEIVFHEAARLDGISDAFSFLSLSSSRVAGMAISWCNIVLSMDNMNTYCFGQMELALPLHLDLAFFRKPVGNKGLTLGRRPRNLSRLSATRLRIVTPCAATTHTMTMAQVTYDAHRAAAARCEGAGCAHSLTRSHSCLCCCALQDG